MTSFILLSNSKLAANDFVSDFCDKKNISVFDRTIINRETLSDSSKTQKLSMGIEDMKKMKEILFLKPIQSREKVIVIQESEALTIPAQNSLLKILEEPPNNTFIFLLTNSLESLIETIHSRCQIIDLSITKEVIPTERLEVLNKILKELPAISINECFVFAERISKKKDEALKWLEDLNHVLRQELIQSVNSDTKNQNKITQLLKFAKKTQETYRIVKTTNTSFRLAIEVMFLSIRNQG